MSEPTREPDAAGRGEAIEAATRAVQDAMAAGTASAEHVARAVLAVVGLRIAAAERDQICAAIEALVRHDWVADDAHPDWGMLAPKDDGRWVHYALVAQVLRDAGGAR